MHVIGWSNYATRRSGYVRDQITATVMLPKESPWGSKLPVLSAMAVWKTRFRWLPSSKVEQMGTRGVLIV